MLSSHSAVFSMIILLAFPHTFSSFKISFEGETRARGGNPISLFLFPLLSKCLMKNLLT